MKAGAIAATTVTATSLNGQGSPNLLRNPDFEIAQRGTTFAAVADGAYCLDGFAHSNASDAVVTVTQDTDVPTFAQAGHLSKHSLKVQVTTAGTSIGAAQKAFVFMYVEGYDFYPCVGKSVTLSFWVKAKKTGVYCVSFRNGAGERSYVKEVTIVAADTWEKKTVTLVMDYSGGTWNYTNGAGLLIGLHLAIGSNFQTTKDAWKTGNYMGTSSQVNALDSTANYINLAQVKLEIGATVTPFVPRAYGEELARNQRYLCVLRATRANSAFGSGIGIGSTSVPCFFNLPVTLRSEPIISAYNVRAYDGVSSRNYASYDSSGWGGGGNVASTVMVFADTLGLSRYVIIGSTDANGYIMFSAEL